jgi:hypothetical protein
MKHSVSSGIVGVELLDTGEETACDMTQVF